MAEWELVQMALPEGEIIDIGKHVATRRFAR